MYLIQRPPLADDMFLSGSVPEPSENETEWVSGGTYAVGTERTRTSTHRVYKCAVARSPSTVPPSTTPPESDPTGWQEMRPTDRYAPFGPYVDQSGLTVYLGGNGAESTTSDITYRLQLRYCNTLALFGLRGARARVRVYTSSGGTLEYDRTMSLLRPATGYWDYFYGPRVARDRLYFGDLPIHPAAEVRIDIEGSAGQQRRVKQIEYGRLRHLPGVALDGFGGTEYGVTNTVRARLYRKKDDAGNEKVLIYGSAQDMQGKVVMSGKEENTVLALLRDVVGKGVAVLPSLAPGYEQRLTFGTVDVVPVARTHHGITTLDLSVSGLPVD